MDAKHRILREVLRNYTVFESLCARNDDSDARLSADQYEISHKGITINFLDLENCLKNLSKRKKEAVFYNVILDMKQKDVAEVMKITTVSVGQYVEQAMLQVVKELWPEEDE
jgi:DNA-directed RNA polymerase specialized sigma24 family protein